MCANHSLWLEQTTRSRVSFNQARPVIPHFANPSPQNTKTEYFNVYKSHIPIHKGSYINRMSTGTGLLQEYSVTGPTPAHHRNKQTLSHVGLDILLI